MFIRRLACWAHSNEANAQILSQDPQGLVLCGWGSARKEFWYESGAALSGSWA